MPDNKQVARFDGKGVEIKPLTPEEQAAQFVPPPDVPSTVTRVQLLLALDAAGFLDGVEAAVAATGGESALRWKHASVFERDNPLLVSLADGLGLSSEDVDTIFVAAAAVS